MQTVPVSHIEAQTIKRIEQRFRQLAHHQGIPAQQLRLNLMERYVNQWLCKNELFDITVCDSDNDFRRQLQKPIPVFLQVTGLTSSLKSDSFEFLLPHYAEPYEHCRIISDERYKPSESLRGLNFKAILKSNTLSHVVKLEWQGYIQIFDPAYFSYPLRNEMIEAVKKDISASVKRSINMSLNQLR